MSPHAANSLVHDLVQMAQAMEELPKVQAALFAKDYETKELSNEIAMLNADLLQSRTYAASLEQKVHTLEVARDDAELSFLEADERTSRALDFVKALFGNAGALIQALEPPKAAPQADSPSLSGPIDEHKAEGGIGPNIGDGTSAALDSHPVGERASYPTAALSTDDTSTNRVEHVETTTSVMSPTGQREPDPTQGDNAGANAGDNTSHIVSAPVNTSSPEEPAALGPYHGKNYYDFPNYIEPSRWLAGGGTEWDYYNRRERSSVL